MPLKRSISKRFKNTVEKTKRIVSPASNAIIAATHSLTPSLHSPSCDSCNRSPLGTHRSAGSSSDDVSTYSGSSQSSNRNATSLLYMRKPSLNNIINDASNDDSPPTLLYSSRIRSSSIRRHGSQPKKSLDFIETSLASNPVPLPNSTIKCDTNINPNLSTGSSMSDHQPILLPTDPIDKSIPPFTTEQLTPIIPQDLEKLNKGDRFEKLSNSLDNSYEKPFISNLNSSSSYSINHPSSIMDESSFTTSTSNSPTRLGLIFKNDQFLAMGNSNNATTNNSTTNNSTQIDPFGSTTEVVQANANPIYVQAHQIDHLDKHLDTKKNDILADQMALNILHDISEENIDELSKLKEEIKLIF